MRVRHVGRDDATSLPALACAAFADTVDEAPLEQWTRKIGAIVGNADVETTSELLARLVGRAI